MAFCGPGWLRGARPTSELCHLMLSDLLEEFDAIRQWLVIIRNSAIEENEVTVTVRGRRQLWLILREIDHAWAKVSILFLGCDRSPSVRNALIDIHNAVTKSVALNRHSRLLPPPIFVNGRLVPPTTPSNSGRLRRFLASVRSRLRCNTPRRSLSTKMTNHYTDDHNPSLLTRFLTHLRNTMHLDNRVATLNT